MGFTETQYSGKWLGQYTYGEGYDEDQKGKCVPFTLVMEVDGKGTMKGNIVDDGFADQIDARAEINGSIQGSFIEFMKVYRHAWKLAEDGSVLEDPRQPSQEIRYVGQYRNTVFTGQWAILVAVVQPDGSIVRGTQGKGYWIMHKEGGGNSG